MKIEQQVEDIVSQKRPPAHRIQQPYLANPKPKKKQKKLKQNPFDDLKLNDDSAQDKNKKIDEKIEWIKPKTTPLSISVVDHSKINKFYSHKSLQKYIKYLLVKDCPNPMWLSIKRQSQVEHIVFIDIQIQNNLFYRYFSQQQVASEQQKQTKNPNILNFLSKFNKPEKKALFKQTAFIRESSDLWDAMLVYDHEAVKLEMSSAKKIEDLPTKLTQQLFKYYQTFILTEQQRKYNLYPMPQLPVYNEYFKLPEPQQDQNQNCIKINQNQGELKNKILIIDCQMVMSGNNFQLARASIMNFQGQLIYDQFFKPECLITNYNTQFSGITQQTLRNVTKNKKDLHSDLQKMVGKNTILVGHSLQNDLHAMKFIHNRVIDTSVLFARKNGSKMKLKTLAYQILNREIQVGSHCSEQDCKATLQLMRQKIEAQKQNVNLQNKCYHLLDELQQAAKKIVLIDQDLEFIKHRKDYLGIQFQQIENIALNKQGYIAKFHKYFDKSVKNPDIIFSRIRKTTGQQWEDYYQLIDETVENLHKKSPNKSVFFLNFQVNNFYQIYPQDLSTLIQRRRPFCLFVVKDQ